MDRYGYLDPIMSTLCYEILNSKRRTSMNQHSVNGFNQKSVERYCANKYKIFSLFMQGDIITKVWLYKDKLGFVHGPFMSYDMDIWNGEQSPPYFSDDLLVSLDNGPFVNIQLWVNRSAVVMKLVEDFMAKTDEMKKVQMNMPGAFRNGFDASRYEKKYSFHKKSENETNVPIKAKHNEDLNKNFAEMFPTLGEVEAKVPHKGRKQRNHHTETPKGGNNQSETGKNRQNEPASNKREEKGQSRHEPPAKFEKKGGDEFRKQGNSGRQGHRRGHAHQQPKEPVEEKTQEKQKEKNPFLDQEKTTNIKLLLGLNP